MVRDVALGKAQATPRVLEALGCIERLAEENESTHRDWFLGSCSQIVSEFVIH